ncbi:MAG: PDZ domain-containing protein, partial [Chlamydiae bacterium]|nr:PDZ domain-containing protein [Chlamydiota bacterium]
ALKRQFCGIGVVIAENANGYYISEISPYGPAAASGLIKVSDQILAIDGKNLETLSLRAVMKLLQGEEGSILSLKVQTKQDEIKNVHLVRKKIVMEEGRIKSEAIPFGKGVIGYFQIDSFYDNREGVTVEKDLREAISELSKETPLVGIILDMRNNLGGFLDQAIKVCGVFIEKGVVVIAKYAGGEIQYSRDYDPYNLFFGPIVVLTSKTSASAAEIVAQTLQDYGAAVVVGDERTYGKGSMQMQTITDESAKYFYKVTVGKYYTISGRSTQIEGVKPHIHVATQYAPYHIGEKFLQFPLQADSLNYQENPKGKLRQFFTIYQQKKNSIWTKMVPVLAKNSEKRLLQNSDYQDFITLIKQCPQRYSPLLRHKDLAKKEAIAIIQDMALIQK